MTSRTTFGKLIERHGRVEIPVIQRDYAQGRADQHIVRDDFLKSLHGIFYFYIFSWSAGKDFSDKHGLS